MVTPASTSSPAPRRKLIATVWHTLLLVGILAFWRKNLLAAMIAHAWSDVYAGYLFQFMRF
jgi:hypothetical protein